MHCHSHGYQTGIGQGIRVIKRITFESLTLRQINERESAAFHGRDVALLRLEEDDEGITGHSTQSSLKLARLLYSPPFLKRDEIRQRRFGGGLDMNDRWWEWEEEKGIQSKEPERERFRWAT
jgi:hypothetical protein